MHHGFVKDQYVFTSAIHKAHENKISRQVQVAVRFVFLIDDSAFFAADQIQES